MKPIFVILIAASAAAVTWFAKPSVVAPNEISQELKIAFYQSAMHPWIKSDEPGRCTICGMELTPVYVGEKGLESDTSANVVNLNQTQVRVLQVQSVEAKVQPLVKTLRVAGMIDDDERRHRILSAYVDGRIDRLFANHHGAEVVAGEPLASIYSPTLLQAEREFRQLSGDLKKNTGVRLQQMGLTKEQIEALPGKSETEMISQILAPLSGTIVEHEVYEGQYVKEGEKLFEIADFNTMWFIFRAYEQDLPWIKTGLEVEVTTPSIAAKTFTGKIVFIDPNIDEATRSALVRVELPNPVVDGKRQFLHKLYGDGIVKLPAPELLALPRSTILQTGSKAVVYVDHANGSYEQRHVELGMRGDVVQEIVAGIKAGERAVSNGNLLIDGQAELNRSFKTEPPAGNESKIFTEARRKAAEEVITAADAMAAALAARDLPAFNKASEPVMELTAALESAFHDEATLTAPLSKLVLASHLHGFDELPKAREAFHEFATASTDFLQPLRGQAGAPEFKVWECFMVDQIVPKAPATGRWIQVASRDGANPYFGKSMLNCAREIKPGEPNP